MKIVLMAPALAASLLLAGCGTTGFQRKEVVVETQYIIRKATDQQKALPPMPQPIDVTTADQTALAEWIARTEGRMLDLEAIIKRLIEFYEKPVTEAERKKLEDEKKAQPPAPAASAAK